MLTIDFVFFTGQGTSTTGSCASSSGGASGGGGAATGGGRRATSGGGSSGRTHKGGSGGRVLGSGGPAAQAQQGAVPSPLLPAPQVARAMAADQPQADVPNNGLSGKFGGSGIFRFAVFFIGSSKC